MKRSRLKNQERETHRRLCTEYAGQLGDFATRLNNACFALSQVDPNWLIWLGGVDAGRPLEEITRTVEAWARMCVLKSYPNLNRTENVFSNYIFAYDGHLIMG